MQSRFGNLGIVACVGLWLISPQLHGRRAHAEDTAEVENGPEPGVGISEAEAKPESADTIPETEAVPDEPLETDSTTAPGAAESVSRPPPDAGLRVRMRLDVAGELFTVPGSDGAAVREPVTMNARFDFDERPATAGAATARHYRDATAAIELAGQKTASTLAGDARRLLVARRGTTPSAYLADGFLTGEEADLLETPFDSLLLDDLLPTGPVRIEQRWDVAADLAAGLLAIDTVDSGGLTARVVEVTDGRAKVVVEGMVDGAADGVPTHVTVEGSFHVPATTAARDEDADDTPRGVSFVFQGRVSQAAVVVQERRQPSHVAPGFDVEARIVVARGPLDEGSTGGGEGVDDRVSQNASEATANETGARAGRRRGVGAPGMLWHRDAAGRFDLVHDARWKRVEDGPHGVVLRLVDHGALVGQCSITSLAGASAGESPAVADVRRDFERSLAGQVSRIDAADEMVREDGLRVIRLEAVGTAGGLPFRWMHYVLAGPAGRASMTFMCEAPLRQRFGDADRRLAEGVRLLAGGAAGGPENPTAARPDGGAGPRR